jgi:predicted transcriptional regulator
MALVTQAEAARILGISRQAVSIAINAGRLETQLDSEGKASEGVHRLITTKAELEPST